MRDDIAIALLNEIKILNQKLEKMSYSLEALHNNGSVGGPLKDISVSLKNTAVKR